MSGVEKLHLQDALENSPQTRNFLRVFERDAFGLKSYSKGLHERCHKILRVQNELCSAYESLSEHLLAYEAQKLPFETEDSILTSTLKQFANFVDEINSSQQVLATQLSDAMMFPLNKFLQADLSEVSTMCEMFQMASSEHEQALVRYMKVKKKDNDRIKMEANDEVFAFRKKFHQTTLHYFSALNSLQYKRKFALLEPFLGFLHAHKSFFQMGAELANRKDLADFICNISACTQQVHDEMGAQTQRSVSLMDNLEAQSNHLYYPQPQGDAPVSPVNTSLSQKGGYLFIRSKQALLGHKWERMYFFTQGGNLMCQGRDDVAGGLAVDLNEESVYAEVTESEDRRFVFQIVSPVQKRTIVLQAENERERDEWLSVIAKVIKEGGYIKDAPLPTKKRSSSSGSHSSGGKEKSQSSYSAENGKQYAGMSPGSKAPPGDKVNSKPGFQVGDTPIVFDLISPGEEQRQAVGQKDGPPNRINPFDQSSEQLSTGTTTPTNAAFSQVFVVRFLGNMEVKGDRGAEMVHETIRQIMAARAIHNVFKMTESHLVVSSENMQLIDPSNQTVRTEFSLPDVSYWMAHQENKRLFAFITRNRTSGSSTPTFACHVFECNTSADEICQAIGNATKIAFEAIMKKRNMKGGLPKNGSQVSPKDGGEVSPKDGSQVSSQLVTAQSEKDVLLANIHAMKDIDDDQDDIPKISSDGRFMILKTESEGDLSRDVEQIQNEVVECESESEA